MAGATAHGMYYHARFPASGPSDRRGGRRQEVFYGVTHQDQMEQ